MTIRADEEVLVPGLTDSVGQLQDSDAHAVPRRSVLGLLSKGGDYDRRRLRRSARHRGEGAGRLPGLAMLYASKLHCVQRRL